MRPRTDLLETFSSFLQFEADRDRGWLGDRRLHRNMQRCCEQVTVETEPERYWALHWHQRWREAQPGAFPQAHLLSYLQEPCYWAAQKASSRFSSAQFGLADCFQLAIAQLDKVLNGFDSQQGFDLKSYASVTFRSFIRDWLRQRREVDICTDWSLLRKVSQKRLGEALAVQGLSAAEQVPYVLTWQLYKELYVPSKSDAQGGKSRRLSAPADETWRAIAQQFNRDRYRLSPVPDETTAQQVEDWMLQSAKAIRSYLYPGTVSMNATRPGQDSGEFIDSLTDEAQATPMGELIAVESHVQRQSQYQQLGEILTSAIAALSEEQQALMQLYYAESKTQTEIAKALGIKQYAISRQLTRIKKALLKALTVWSSETLHISPSPDLVDQSSAALEAWLSSHFASSATSPSS